MRRLPLGRLVRRLRVNRDFRVLSPWDRGARIPELRPRDVRTADDGKLADVRAGERVEKLAWLRGADEWAGLERRRVADQRHLAEDRARPEHGDGKLLHDAGAFADQRAPARIGLLHAHAEGLAELDLTSREFDILRLLVRNRGEVVSRDRILDEVWPAVQGMQGCLGMSMIIDREAGRGITTTSWDTEEALHASRDMVTPLRSRAAAPPRPCERRPLRALRFAARSNSRS